MSTAQAVRNLRAVGDDEFSASIDEAMRIVGAKHVEFPPAPDPEADVDRWADILNKSVAFRRKRIAATKRREREFIASHKAEIKRLEAEIAEHKEGAARKIEAEQKIVKASKAFLAAVEE